ncbi:MAG: CPBP family intramembrane glutamic endopeptidase [Bacteroidota bacterium]|nr:CPBP family intramembrane glutamic endopeptidase [Bacteroidota bacterium]
MIRNKTLFFFLSLVILLGVFWLNMTYAGLIPYWLLTIIRAVFIIIFFSGWVLFSKRGRKYLSDLYFSLMALNLAFLLVSFFTVDLWGLNIETPRGIALAKLSDSLIISTVVIASFLIAGYKLNDIYITGGRLMPGLIIGVAAFFIMGLLAVTSTEQLISTGFIKTNLAWILIFVLFNGFLEELIFRGIFLKALNNFLKPFWSIVLTAIVFGAAHLQVTYTTDVLLFAGITLVLGFIWGYLIYYTKSLLASVLFHAGADLLIILPIFASYGVGI